MGEDIAASLHEWYCYTHRDAFLGVVFRNLWTLYGPTFSNDCEALQAAVVVTSLSLQRSVLRWTRSRVLCFEWISRFHQKLEQAIREASVNESHLFALFWVIIAHTQPRLRRETDNKTLEL